jgi:hypothetical protein
MGGALTHGDTMMCVHHFQPTTDITDTEWANIKHDLATAFDQIQRHPETLPKEAKPLQGRITNGDMETVINHHTELYETLNNHESIVFNGLDHAAGETFVLERENRFCAHKASSSCETGSLPYDWLVRAALLIVQSHSPCAYQIASTAHSEDWNQTAKWLSTILNRAVISLVESLSRAA